MYRICMLCYENPFELKGGTKTRAREILLRLLKEDEMLIELFTPYFHRQIELEDIVVREIYVPKASPILKVLLFFLQIISMKKDLSKYDIIDSTSGFYGFPIVLMKKLFGLKTSLVTHLHHPALQLYWDIKYLKLGFIKKLVETLYKRVASLLEGYAARNSDVVVTVSTHTAEIAVRHYGVDQNRINLIPNGIDAKKFRPTKNGKSLLASKYQQYPIPHNSKIILYVGRLDPRKSIETLIEAGKIIHRHIKNLVFIIVGKGEGDYKNHLRSLSRRYGLSTIFMQDITDEKLPVVYNAADVFVLPSLSEGFPCVLLEALACATPTVTTNVGGMTDIVINGKTGFLVNPRNPSELAAAVMKLLTNENLRMEMGERGRRVAKNRYSWDRIVKQLVRVYIQIIRDYSNN